MVGTGPAKTQSAEGTVSLARVAWVEDANTGLLNGEVRELPPALVSRPLAEAANAKRLDALSAVTGEERGVANGLSKGSLWAFHFA